MPTWGSNRNKLMNAVLFVFAPLALAGIVAAAFVLSSPGKGVAAAHTGFQAGAGPSGGQQQPQGAGSTTGAAPSPSPSSSATRTGKRSTMPSGTTHSTQPGNPRPGQNPGPKPKPKPKPAQKPKPKPAGPVTPSNLGIPNFDGYCGHIGQGSAVMIANNAYGWHCSLNPGLILSVRNACGWSYGLSASKVINVSTNYFSADSWQCWRTNGILGQLNFTTYCAAAGLGAAKLTAYNAYGWSCTAAPTIDTLAACQLVFHNSNAFARFAVFADPYSWQCWA
jgi:hypothetical protein